MSPDGKELAAAVVGEAESDLIKLDLASGKITSSVRAKEVILGTLRYHSGGKVLATESVVRFDSDAGGNGLRFWKHTEWPNKLAIDHKKVGGIDAPMKSSSGAKVEISFLEFTPDKKRVVTASAEQMVGVWTLPKCSRFAELKLPGGDVFLNIDVSAEGSGRVVASGPTTLAVWDIASKKLLGAHKAGTGKGKWAAGVAAISPDGERVISAYSRGEEGKDEGWDAERTGLLIWDVPLGDAPTFELKDAHDGTPINDVVFGPDGKFVVTAAADDVKLWKITQ